jgi:hypothetical protein
MTTEKYQTGVQSDTKKLEKNAVMRKMCTLEETIKEMPFHTVSVACTFTAKVHPNMSTM